MIPKIQNKYSVQKKPENNENAKRAQLGSDTGTPSGFRSGKEKYLTETVLETATA
jgi:hypothetical protein